MTTDKVLLDEKAKGLKCVIKYYERKNNNNHLQACLLKLLHLMQETCDELKLYCTIRVNPCEHFTFIKKYYEFYVADYPEGLTAETPGNSYFHLSFTFHPNTEPPRDMQVNVLTMLSLLHAYVSKRKLLSEVEIRQKYEKKI